MPSKPEDAVLALRVTPRSSKNEVRVESDGSLKVWVTAPPVEGEANKAICEIVAKQLKVAKSRVSIASGEASREKRIRISGMVRDEVIALLCGRSHP